MVIVQVTGGLGNQMFQYAFATLLRSLGKRVKLDVRAYQHDFSTRIRSGGAAARHYNANYHLHRYYLDKVYGIQDSFAAEKDYKPYHGGFIQSHRYLMFALMKFGYKPVNKKLTSEENLPLDDILSLRAFEVDAAFYTGYWQYFSLYEPIRDALRQAFAFKVPLDGRNAALQAQMAEGESVSLHVRRGDYANHPEMYPLLGADYYRRALECVQERRSAAGPVFCFSDDVAWCRENLSFIEDLTCVDWNLGEDNYKDMQLMSSCRHNIIANSSFSAWAAWLNENPDKTVISPDTFYNNTQTAMNAFFPPDWMQIPIGEAMPE